MSGPLVIIPCGAKKKDVPAPAGDLYTGSYFKACKKYALTVTSPDRILILSAKHGLVRLDTVLQPYNVTFGDPGCISLPTIRNQAEQMGVRNEPTVIVAAGKRYFDIARAIWPRSFNVLEGTTGMGDQIGRLSRMAKGEPR